MKHILIVVLEDCSDNFQLGQRDKNFFQSVSTELKETPTICSSETKMILTFSKANNVCGVRMKTLVRPYFTSFSNPHSSISTRVPSLGVPATKFGHVNLLIILYLHIKYVFMRLRFIKVELADQFQRRWTSARSCHVRSTTLPFEETFVGLPMSESRPSDSYILQ